MSKTQIKGHDIESSSLESKISEEIDFTKIETDQINIISVDPADTATLFGTNDNNNSILHIRIGNETGDIIRFESWNGSAATSLMEIGQNTVTIKGNLTVTGTTTTINSETLEVGDNFIILNSGVTGAPSLDAGIKVERGSEDDAVLKWNETEDRWEISNGAIINGRTRLTGATVPFDFHVEPGANDTLILDATGYTNNVMMWSSDGKVYIGNTHALWSDGDHLKTTFNVLGGDGGKFYLSTSRYNTGTRIGLFDSTMDNKIDFYFDGVGLGFYFTSNGKAYANDGWYTFSPEFAPETSGYDWVEEAYKEANKPRKPKNKKVEELTTEETEKYGKDIARIAIAAANAVKYLAEVQQKLAARIKTIEEKLGI